MLWQSWHAHLGLRRLLVVVNVLRVAFLSPLFLQLMAHRLVAGLLVVATAAAVAVVLVCVQNVQTGVGGGYGDASDGRNDREAQHGGGACACACVRNRVREGRV